MDGGDWICSGSAATDARGDISVVLTAAHCAYDQKNKAFATNWMFFPEFDTTPSYDCAQAVYGCWAADRLVVHSGFAKQAGFTTTATLYDWAFAVTSTGGKALGQLDALGSFPIAFSSYGSGTATTATGYPAGGKYSPGYELVYCSGGLAFDFWNANRTYRLSCDMTGGSSGGPWLTSFDASGDSGKLSSLNSYTYSGGTSMYGPKFNASTQATWNAAVESATGSGDIVVP
jgi:V8-like Glu-specific endopeptidase